MNVLVVGAAGRTGRLVVERASAAGHTVTVLVRDAGSYRPPAGGVRVVAGDATDPATLRRATAGQDAVIDAVGPPKPYVHTDLERTVAAGLVAAMGANGVRRLVVVSALGVGDSRSQAGFFFRAVLLPTFLRGSTRDKAAMEGVVRASGTDHVVVRPAVLTDAEAAGAVRVVGRGETARTITRADVAQFLVDQLEDDAHLGQAVTIASP